MVKRVVGYVRVSTAEQAGADRLSIDQQVSTIKNFCATYGLELYETYVDAGVSGEVPVKNRRGGLAMLTALYHGYADGIVVYEVSRLGRSIVDIPYIVRELFAHNLLLWSVMERGPLPYDGTNPADKQQLDTQAMFAEWFRVNLSHRIKGVVRYMKSKRLVHNSTPLVCQIGTVESNGRVVRVFDDNEHMLRVARKLRRWRREEGLTVRQCLRRLEERGIEKRGGRSGKWNTTDVDLLAHYADGFYNTPTPFERRKRKRRAFDGVVAEEERAENEIRRLPDEVAVRAWAEYQAGSKPADVCKKYGYSPGSMYRRWKKLGLSIRSAA